MAEQMKSDTIYIDENDARALGIFRGQTQAVTINGKPIKVEYVDEKVFLGITPEEQKLLAEAPKLFEEYKKIQGSDVSSGFLGKMSSLIVTKRNDGSAIGQMSNKAINFFSSANKKFAGKFSEWKSKLTKLWNEPDPAKVAKFKVQAENNKKV